MNRRFRAAALLSIGLLACGKGGPSAPSSSADDAARFVEVASEYGLDFRHVSGAGPKRRLPEIMGGGVAWLDADGDGKLDAFFTNSGSMDGSRDAASGDRLFLNRGGRFVDATEAAGVGGSGYGMGVATGDFDGDGDLDVYVTNLGPNRLLRNDGGRFVDVTEAAGVGDPGWSVSAAFFDYDADGDLDLFVGNYVAWRDAPIFNDRDCRNAAGVRDYCSPQSYGARSYSTLYRNEGGGRFRDVGEKAGLRAKAGTALGVLCTDLDGDGRVDVYVSNDQMPSFAWINRGDGTFVERGAELGLAVDETGKSQAGMGVDAGDADGDGDLDLWKVHLDRESHVLYANEGGWYSDRTTAFGLSAPTRPFTGFGTAFFDADSDGLLDVFVANGRVEASTSPRDPSDPYAEPDQFLRCVAPGKYVDASASAGPALAAVFNSRGAAFGDFDDDGDVDVLVVCRDAKARLLRNDSVRRGAWFGVRVVDGAGSDLLGARIVATAGGRRFVDEVRTAASYASANDPRVLFGLGAATTVDSVEVTTPRGVRRTFGPFAVGRYETLRL